jgi:hypothetical protein
MAKRTFQPLIPESKLDAVLKGLLAVPKAEVDAAVAKPIRERKKSSRNTPNRRLGKTKKIQGT